MDGFRRVHKQGRAAGGAERGGNFLRDDAAFAHAGDDDAVAGFTTLEDAGDGAVKVSRHGAFETLGEREQGLGLDAN